MNIQPRLKKIPVFKTEQEERDFWLTHDTCDYVNWDKAKIMKRINIPLCIHVTKVPDIEDAYDITFPLQTGEIVETTCFYGFEEAIDEVKQIAKEKNAWYDLKNYSLVVS